MLIAACLVLGCGGKSETESKAAYFPCQNPQAIVDTTTGYVKCDNYFYRASIQVCPTTVPRAGEVPGGGVGGGCRTDADCASQVHGYCGPSRLPGVLECQSGCLADSDCANGEVCVCGDPIGQCIAAGCKSDADCGAGMHCASADPAPLSPAQLCSDTVLACQQLTDECATSADCPQDQRCVVESGASGARKCTAVGCAEPP